MRRERRINGPILLVVISLLTWAVGFGILVARMLDRVSTGHVHTEECWDH